jgi:aminomethyltransferase
VNSTALLDHHKAAGARLVDFAGWRMPLQYKGILEEHRAVRTACGMFDISHMGEFFVRGPAAASWLDHLLTANIASLPAGHARYALLLDERGGVIDDLIAYRFAPQEFLLVVNASKAAEDAAWMRDHLRDEVTFEDVSSLFSALAVQGPDSAEICLRVLGHKLPTERNRVLQPEGVGSDLWICTTGYTGESGFELVCRNERVASLWNAFLDAGCVPCGLGARDLLRIEMGYPLNGSDLSRDRTALEAGLKFAVDLSKSDFVGKAALENQTNALPSRLCGLLATQKAPPFRPHYPVLHDGIQVAETTSGGLSPSLGVSIAMAYLPTALSTPGTTLAVEVRGGTHPVQVVRRPFVEPASNRPTDA